MHTHANARLTQQRRLRLVSQHLKDNRSLAELAAEAGISLRWAYKWLARFLQAGHRITGKRQQDRSTSVGYGRVHVVIDDATRLAYVEVLADEQQATASGFLSRALAWFNSQRVECRQVMSDNGLDYISKAFAKACSVLKLKHIRTRPYTPRTNGKAERFIQTLCKEWAYAMPFHNSQKRKAWLPRYLSLYNRIRRHSALGGRSPQQRLQELLC